MSSNIIIYPKLLGKGAFGEVSLGLDKRTSKLVAVKKETKAGKDQTGKVLKHENSILRYMGMPPVAFWEDSGACFMVLPLMGPSLDRLHQMCNNTFCLKTCVKIGLQMLNQIEICHGKGILHRDIKPANFLVNYRLPHSHIKLVDYGLSTKVSDAVFKTGVPRVGSLRYMSKNIHKGIEASFRDDIYSIAYVIIFMFVGHLPWRGVVQNLSMEEKHKSVLSLKEKFTNRRLCNKNACPECTINAVPCTFVSKMTEFLDYVDVLKFTDKPDYERLKSYLQDILITHGGNIPAPWDWEALFHQSSGF